MSTLANERVAWFNGKIMPEHEVRIPFRDSSWLYGDGAFDMTRSFGGKPFKLKEASGRPLPLHQSRQVVAPTTGSRLSARGRALARECWIGSASRRGP